MNLQREFSPAVLGRIVPTDLSAEPDNHLRTPLHIDYPEKSWAEPAAAAPIEAGEIGDPDIFNAVGSLHERGQPKVHRPVIDVDGGARLQEVRGSKVIARAYPDHDHDREETPSYGPNSLLRDVLGDNGIDLEVFSATTEKWSHMMQSYSLAGKRVTAIVLRERDGKKDMFDVVDSTQEGHSHLYIQRAFNDTDHQTLISELGNLGIISRRWQEITEQAGMGIVRTPWTEKEVSHRPF